MSAFSGKYARGAMAVRRQTKRAEAEQRRQRAQARRVVEEYAEAREGSES